MTAPHRSVRPARLGHLAAGAAVLCAAVVFAPFRLASVWPGGGYRDLTDLRQAVSSDFVRFWAAGEGHLGGLARATDFWARFHLVKAVLAAGLLVVLSVLVARVGREFAEAGDRGGRVRLALAGVVTVPLTVLALLVTVANVQGAVAPLSSVLGVLALTEGREPLAGTVGRVRHGLAAGSATPPQDVLVGDFTVYHQTMAALAGVVTVGLLVAAALLWRRARVSGVHRRRRLVLALGGVVLVALAAFFGVVTAANVSTAVHPVPALLAFFDGGG